MNIAPFEQLLNETETEVNTDIKLPEIYRKGNQFSTPFWRSRPKLLF